MQQETITNSPQERVLIEKIRALEPAKIAEVEDFVDFLSFREQDRGLMHASNRLAEDAFKNVWDNPEDDEYDLL